MSTNEDVIDHVRTIKRALNAAQEAVSGWQEYGSVMTTSNKAAHLAKVTTVPSALQHASNCSICNGWDGSVRPPPEE